MASVFQNLIKEVLLLKIVAESDLQKNTPFILQCSNNSVQQKLQFCKLVHS